MPKYKHLSGLKTLTLVMLHDWEVLKITIDKKGVLAEGQWSFAVDTKSEEFKKEMGINWSGLTWNIVLAK